MNWLHYIGEANLYLAVFYLAYRIFLVKETYNQLNRAYLLFACVAAFTLPVLQLGALKHIEPAQPVGQISYTTVPAQTMQPIGITQPSVVHASAPLIIEQHLTWQDYLIYAYAIGCGALLLALFVKLFTLIRLIRSAERGKQGNYELIYLPETNVAFSFFNYLFIGTDANGAGTIIRHELVHIRQKHSLDILFLELLKIINWFNPFVYLLQNSLKTTHEYIADEQTAVHETDPITYATFLVNNAYGAGGSSITHSFFNYNLLKKRIIMLNQERSGKSARLKYLIAAPLCAGLLCASTLAFSKDYGFIDLDPAKTVSTKVNAVTKHQPKVISAHQTAALVKTSVAIENVTPNNLTTANKTSTVKPAKITTAIPAAVKPVAPDSVAQADLQKFYADLKWYIQYEQAQRDKKIQGRVIVHFCVDNNGELQYLCVYQEPSIRLGYEVSWAIQHSAFLKPLKGNWAMSINFDMGGVPPLTTPITEIPVDTTGYHWDSANEPGYKQGDIRVIMGKKGPLNVYNPQNMDGPYKTPVKVLSELVIKAPETTDISK